MTPHAQRRARALVGCTAAGALVAVGLGAVPSAAADGHVLVSEIHYDNVGTDVDESIEVQAPLGTDLTGWSVVLYNGNTENAAVTYDTRVLSGTVTEPAGDPSGDGVVVLEYPANGIQNGPRDGWALVDPAGQVVELLSYAGTFTAGNGPAAGMTSTDIGAVQSGSTPVGASIQRFGDTWVADTVNTFGEVNETVGLGSTGEVPGTPDPVPGVTCEDTAAAIGAVQGSGTSTPVAGQTVTVRGVVTSDTPGLGGFTVQDAGDGDPATSDGIFVLSGSDVSLGDVVTVRGTAEEDFGLTRVSAGGQVAACGTGALPAPAVLPMPSDAATRERFESMRVTVEEELTVTGTFGLERFGEVRVSVGGILPTSTEVAMPGAPQAAVEAENQRRELTIDDANNAQNVRPVPYLSTEQSLRIGDTVADLGDHVLSFAFGQWRLQPVTGAPDQVVWDREPRPQSPADVGGDVQVGAYNVLNYFVTLTSEDSNARGASTPADFAVQESKIVQGILGLGADVVALQEIEYGAALGRDKDNALIALTDALNAADGVGEWDYVPTPDYVRATPDVIQNAIIYRSDVVTPVGEARTGGGFDTGAWSNAREPVAQTFAAPDGDELTVVSNHFKSKGAGGATGDNLDQGDGQGAYNADRTRQALALVAFAEDIEASTGDSDIFLMGDFNAYGMEDPIRVMEAAGYVDVLKQLEDDYTYTFDQRNGNLDHAMVNEAAVPKLTGVDVWQVNAAEPFAYQYSSGIAGLIDPTSPFRASDHNPILVGVDTEAPLGTDTSLADVLGEVSGPFDRDGSDYDVLGALVAAVLTADPDSPVAVLADPEVALTAFLPNDEAFRATAEEVLPGRVPQERVAYNRLLDTLGVDGIEQVLLGHVVLGETLESADVLALDGEQLTTAAGTTLTIDVRTDGSVAVLDEREGNRDALLVLDAVDLNIGQVQVGHTVDRVLLGD